MSGSLSVSSGSGNHTLRRVLSALLAISYPACIYVAITRWGARPAGLIAVCLLLPLAVVRLRSARRMALLDGTWPILGAATLSALAAIVGDERFLLAVPVIMSFAACATFGLSLRTGRTPIVERLSRARRERQFPSAPIPEDLPQYCRRVTQVWCLFLLLNGVVCAGLAIFGPLEWWAAYAGGIAYALMAALFLGERLVRPVHIQRVSPH